MLPDDPPLIRRPHDNPHQHGWDVYYGDVRIGHIGTRAGVPTHVDQWAWSLSFYPGTDIGQGAAGTGASLEDCRSAFERAWLLLKPRVAEPDYERWREQRDWTAWLHRMHDAKLLLPTQTQDGRSRCFCGEEITILSAMEHARTAHHGIGAK